MPPSKTILFARSDPTASPAPQHTDTSFFTFLIALLILLFASGALVLRAILVRRRFRRRVQEAIAAGIILPGSQAIPEHKPELYEVCVRAANNDSDWKLLMPVCATEVNAAKCASKRSPKTRLYHSDATVTRLISATFSSRRRPSIPSPPDPTPMSAQDAAKPPIVQVAVLIAMPTEGPFIPSAAELDAPPISKPQDSCTEEPLPNIVFGISNLLLSSDISSP